MRGSSSGLGQRHFFIFLLRRSDRLANFLRALFFPLRASAVSDAPLK